MVEALFKQQKQVGPSGGDFQPCLLIEIKIENAKTCDFDEALPFGFCYRSMGPKEPASSVCLTHQSCLLLFVWGHNCHRFLGES